MFIAIYKNLQKITAPPPPIKKDQKKKNNNNSEKKPEGETQNKNQNKTKYRKPLLL